jgi:hypothetical protein
MIRFRHCAFLGVLLALGGCVAPPPPGYVARPGQGKSAAAFQQDDEACHKQADTSLSQTPATPPAGSGATTSMPDAGAIYSQCMTAKGNTVTSPSFPTYPVYAYAYPYVYGYPYAYPYYPYAYPAVVDGPFIGFGFGFCCRGYHGGYRGGYRGGIHR